MENLFEDFLGAYKTHLKQFATIAKAVDNLLNRVKELEEERKMYKTSVTDVLYKTSEYIPTTLMPYVLQLHNRIYEEKMEELKNKIKELEKQNEDFLKTKFI